MKKDAILSKLKTEKVIALIRAESPDGLLDCAKALAAGGLAHMTLNPASEVQTMTAYMVQIFLGDAPAFGIENLSSYAVAAVLSVGTLAMAAQQQSSPTISVTVTNHAEHG